MATHTRKDEMIAAGWVPIEDCSGCYRPGPELAAEIQWAVPQERIDALLKELGLNDLVA